MNEETRLIRSGKTPTPLVKTVGPPIQRGSTILAARAVDLYDDTLQTYGRQGLAAEMTLKDALCDLEGATTTQLYPSGVAALAGAMLAVLKTGDDVLVADCAYKPTRRFCDTVLRRFGVSVRYYDPALSAAELLALTTPATRLIVLESPGSLTFDMQDAPGIAALARQKHILTLIDNTWGAGLLFKPIAHGIDLSVQSLTKYVGGHSDVFMGSAATGDPTIGRLLDAGQMQLGWAVSPDCAYQMLRGLRTLPVRMLRHGASGIEIARWLRNQPEVAQVLHPALPGAPGHALWARDYSGACGLFSIVMQPAPMAAVETFLDNLKLFGLGYSWGGFESLILHCDPQLEQRRFANAFAGPVVRLHVGLENPEDLITDLRRGLDAFAALT